jgi:hypothetical protein
MMAAMLGFYWPLAREPVVGHLACRPKIGFAERAADVWRAAAQVLAFLWATLALTFLTLVAAGLLFA